MNRAYWLAGLLSVIAASGCSQAPSSSASSSSPGGSTNNSNPTASAPASSDKNGPPPAWTLNDLDGKPVSLSDFKGKVVVLDIWATWCPPCRAEIPNFIALQNEWKDKGVTVVGMSIDSTGPADVKKFAEQNGMNYPIVMADDKTSTAYGVEAIPLTIVINKNGNVVNRHLGQTEKSVFEDDIKKALGE